MIAVQERRAYPHRVTVDRRVRHEEALTGARALIEEYGEELRSWNVERMRGVLPHIPQDCVAAIEFADRPSEPVPPVALGRFTLVPYPVAKGMEFVYAAETGDVSQFSPGLGMGFFQLRRFMETSISLLDIDASRRGNGVRNLEDLVLAILNRA